MGRPREFDEDEVLQRALEVFWTHGYEATSVTDLMHATGLAKGSVYKGFGDKKSLFMRTLDMYLEHGRTGFVRLDRAHASALDVLRAWLTHAVEMGTTQGVRKGCFAVNCTVELAPHDADVRQLLKTHERQLEGLYERTLQRGIADGSLRTDLEPREAARWLTTVVAGIQVAGKTGMSRKDALAMVSFALDALKA